MFTLYCVLALCLEKNNNAHTSNKNTLLLRNADHYLSLRHVVSFLLEAATKLQCGKSAGSSEYSGEQ